MFSAIHEPGLLASMPPVNDPLTAEWEDLHLAIQNKPFRLELGRKSDGLRLQTTNSAGCIGERGWIGGTIPDRV